MIVILHYPPKSVSPATTGIIWSSHESNFTLSPQKKFSKAHAGIIRLSNDCNFTLSPQKKKFRRLPPPLFGHFMVVILHYPPQKITPAAPVII